VISVVGVSVLGGPQWANIDYIRLRLQSLVDTDDEATPCLLILLVARRGC